MKSKNCPLPQSPPPHIVRAFNEDNESPPSLDRIAIDWQDSLRSSSWNMEAINLIVIDFQEKVRTGSYASVIFDQDTMNLHELRGLCIDKLRRTHQAHREHSKIEDCSDMEDRQNAARQLSSRNARRQRLDRHNTRKHGVSG